MLVSLEIKTLSGARSFALKSFPDLVKNLEGLEDKNMSIEF